MTKRITALMNDRKAAGLVDQVRVEPIEAGAISAEDLKDAIDADPKEWEAFRIWEIGPDGYEHAVPGQLIWHFDYRRAGACFGGNSIWTDASNPWDAAERFLGLNGKSIVN
jgi:hypothetical protein